MFGGGSTALAGPGENWTIAATTANANSNATSRPALDLGRQALMLQSSAVPRGLCRGHPDPSPGGSVLVQGPPSGGWTASPDARLDDEARGSHLVGSRIIG